MPNCRSSRESCQRGSSRALRRLARRSARIKPMRHLLVRRPLIVVAVDALAPLVALLGFDRQSRNRPCFQAFERDRLARFFTIAVGAILDALQCSIDFGDQFALTVTGAQFDRAVGLRGRPVGEIGVILALVLEMLKRFTRLLKDILPPIEQLQPEIFPLALIHKRLFVAWPIEFAVRSKARSKPRSRAHCWAHP